MQTQKEITVGQIWEEVDPRLIRKVRVVEVASLEGPKGILGSSQKTESMVTPVFATPILTTSWLA
ncbi:hypothetical protein TUM9868_45770 (plasmid) [Escherichia coli]|nr:hypothetical protein TUM9868_45770 [Escherichia coli]